MSLLKITASEANKNKVSKMKGVTVQAYPLNWQIFNNFLKLIKFTSFLTTYMYQITKTMTSKQQPDE